MKQRLWYTLYKLLELGAGHRTINTSTLELAKALELSQQTASRHLIELEKMGYVKKNASFRGVEIRIVEKGMEELRKVYLRLKAMVESAINSITLEGTVFSGFGEGAYYLSQKGYKSQLERKVGFVLCPGTLNLKLSPSEIVKKKELETYPSILIKGFRRGRRQFGDVRCYPTIINDKVEGAAIMINRTHYDDSVLEVIAPVHLRTELNLGDGSKVTIKFSP